MNRMVTVLAILAVVSANSFAELAMVSTRGGVATVVDAVLRIADIDEQTRIATTPSIPPGETAPPLSVLKEVLEDAGVSVQEIPFPKLTEDFAYPTVWRHKRQGIILLICVSQSGSEVFCYGESGAYRIRLDALRESLLAETGLAFHNPKTDRGPKLWLQNQLIPLGKFDGLRDERRSITALNVGTAPLIFHAASFNDNSATLELPETALMPGESIELPIQLDTSGKSNGPINLELVVESNSLGSPQKVMLHGRVLRSRLVEPQISQPASIAP